MVFEKLFEGQSQEEYLHKPKPEKWCLLEIACHLFDEEREDFRARLRQALNQPEQPLPPIDPQGWVGSRNYLDHDYNSKVAAFLNERELSIDWLRSLVEPNWENAYQHPKYGPLNAKLFLNNWLAHDYLHIRQILSVKYDYLNKHSTETLL